MERTAASCFCAPSFRGVTVHIFASQFFVVFPSFSWVEFIPRFLTTVQCPMDVTDAVLVRFKIFISCTFFRDSIVQHSANLGRSTPVNFNWLYSMLVFSIISSALFN